MAAYGESGRQWLSALAVRLRRFELLDRLIANEMLQLWCVDTTQTEHLDRGLRAVQSEGAPAELRELLEAGARAENRVDFPNIDLQSVLVLERWSLFDEASAARQPLKHSLALAALAGCEAGAAREFDYEWISLLDTVRSAAAVTPEERSRVRALMAADDIATRVLLIDRVDAANAVISRALANECYSSIAVAMLTSDAAFLPADGSGVPLFVSVPEEGVVTPVAVVNLHHPVAQIRSAISDHIRLQLAEASLEGPAARWSSMVQPLDTLAEIEVNEIASGSFSPRAARERRERSASELLRVVLATRGRDTSCRDQLDRAVALIDQAIPKEHGAGQQVAALSVMAIWPSVSVALAAAAIALLGAAIQWHRRRRAPNANVGLPLNHADARGALEARRQWGELGDRLGSLVAELARQLRSRQAPALGEPSSTWARTGTSPYDWSLIRDPLPRTDIVAPTDHEYSELAQRCFQLLVDGHTADDVLDQAIEQLADERLRKSHGLAAAVIHAAFSQGHALPITQSLGPRDTPLLASTPANATGDVYWIGDKRAVTCEHLKSLEPVATRGLVRCAAQDDPERTTRLAFGKPIPWQAVISLSSIGL